MLLLEPYLQVHLRSMLDSTVFDMMKAGEWRDMSARVRRVHPATDAGLVSQGAKGCCGTH